MSQREKEKTKDMEIRKAVAADLDQIMNIYQYAREFMKQTGNPGQWGEHFPPRELIEGDIEKQQSYVCVENGKVQGVFVFIIGEDPTYAVIEDGAWKNDEPYGTIHRIAGAAEAKGIFANSIAYCKGQVDNLRIDTHRDNRVMQHLIEKSGFERCGIIYVADGSERLAYQFTLENRTNV